MKSLEEKIINEGEILPGNILKVDSFLNHQIDAKFLDEIGKDFFEHFKDKNINKIVTIEASGIAIAMACARYFECDIVFAKKGKSANMHGDLYEAVVDSYTYKKPYKVTLSKKYLSKEDNVLIVDDFLAQGNAMKGLISICEMAGASVSGVGIVIEKGFQDGGEYLRNANVPLYSQAIIDGYQDGKIIFR